MLQAFTGSATMTAVNFGEVAGWLVLNGADETSVRSLRNCLVFPIIPVDDDLAIRVALLEPLTRSTGLGIGDHLCLALAARSNAVAVTADTTLKKIPEAAGVEVQIIR